jgi:hypothetical protein
VGVTPGARYYHPTLQRFISEDPIEFASGDVNLYAYVGNRPTDTTDPLGYYGWKGAVGAAAFNASIQFGANFWLTGGDWARSARCINLVDVGISAAFGAIAPTFLGNIVMRNPGPLGMTRLEHALIWLTAVKPMDGHDQDRNTELHHRGPKGM